MQDTPSRSALRVALRRAAHQLYDAPPLVFPDPFAVPILGPHAAELARTPGSAPTRRRPSRPRTHSLALRAFLVARSRYTEDLLAQAVAHGITQYILLGAGLDTFAHRNRHPTLHVYEIDHPATQTWKRSLLAHAGLAHLPRLTYIPLDLDSALADNTFTSALTSAGFDPTRPAFFSALGLIPYLTPQVFQAALRTLASLAPGTTLVFDYNLPRESLARSEQLAHDSISARVRSSGEPFHLFFTPEQIAAQLCAHNLHLCEDLDGQAINALYFNHRTDNLRVLPNSAHLLHAQV